MTTLEFTYRARPLPDGRHVIHMYIDRHDTEWATMPRAARREIEDAEIIIHDLLRENDVAQEELLLKSGEPPSDSFAICHFFVNVRWDKARGQIRYSRGDWNRDTQDKMWNPVFKLMMNQQSQIVGILKARMRKEEKENLK